MKAKYGRKRPADAALQPAADPSVEPLVKVQRMRVSSIYTHVLQITVYYFKFLNFSPLKFF